MSLEIDYSKMSEYDLMKKGDFNLCKKLIGGTWWYSEFAIINNHIDFLKSINFKYGLDGNNLCLLALQFGNFECFKYLYEQGIKFDKEDFYYAVSNIDCLKYVLKNVVHDHDKDTLFNSEFISDMVVLENNIECIRYLDESGYLFDYRILLTTIEHNRIDLFRFFSQVGYLFEEKEVKLIIAKGYKDFLEVVINTGYILYDDEIEDIFIQDNVDLLKFIYDKGISLNTDIYELEDPTGITLEKIVEYCINYKSSKCFTFLIEKNFNFYEIIYDSIVESGHLDFIKLLINNDNYKDIGYCINRSIECNNFDCMKYLHQSGYLFYSNSYRICSRNGFLRCLMYICDNTHISREQLDDIGKDLISLSEDKIEIDWYDLELRKFLFLLIEIFSYRFLESPLGKLILDKQEEIEIYQEYTTKLCLDNICKDVINNIIYNYY